MTDPKRNVNLDTLRTRLVDCYLEVVRYDIENSNPKTRELVNDVRSVIDKIDTLKTSYTNTAALRGES